MTLAALVPRLLADGHAVTLLYRRDSPFTRVQVDQPKSFAGVETLGLYAPVLWTAVRLSIALWWHRPDVLFLPAHSVPLYVPWSVRVVVVVHGLEYETVPEGYSTLDRILMRLFVRRAAERADRIVAVSQATRTNLVQYYDIPESKIIVSYEGLVTADPTAVSEHTQELSSVSAQVNSVFMGRLEVRKNVGRILAAWREILNHSSISKPTGELHFLGRLGFGGESFVQLAKNTPKTTVHGYVSETKKQELLAPGNVLIYPSLDEGFGLPVLEGVARGLVVVTSLVGSLPEVAAQGAVFVNPYDVQSIARGWQLAVDRESLRTWLPPRAKDNLGRFSWGSHATTIAETLTPRLED